MTGFDIAALSALAGRTVCSTDEIELGKVVDAYQSADGAGTFVTVSTGVLSGAAFVPLEKATLDGERVVVPYGPDLIADAPRVGAGGELSAAEEDRLYRHYELTAPGGDLIGTHRPGSDRARLRRCVVPEPAHAPAVPVGGEQSRIEAETVTETNIVPVTHRGRPVPGSQRTNESTPETGGDRA